MVDGAACSSKWPLDSFRISRIASITDDLFEKETVVLAKDSRKSLISEFMRSIKFQLRQNSWIATCIFYF